MGGGDASSTRDRVLVLNCGSSSVRMAVLDPETGNRDVAGHAERVGTPDLTVKLTRPQGQAQPEHAGTPARDAATNGHGNGHADVVARLVRALTDAERASVLGVGHRVVHGGPDFSQPTVVTSATVAAMQALRPLAPLHMSANLAGIEAAQEAMPGLPHVAVFDTAFHQTIPPVAYRYAVPEDWFTTYKVRRYGFHGTSHAFVAGRAATILGRPLSELRMVTLHLGNGASATAVRGGISVDTTMGLTPLEGLVMGTRSGDIDPSVIDYLVHVTDQSPEQVLHALNHDSGVLGLSGLSNDMRTVEEAAERGHPGARLAVDLMVYRIAKTVGAFAVPLGRLDAIVFTGGIGERSPIIRAQVLKRLEVFGVQVDEASNALNGGPGGVITRPGGVTALVVPTDEELAIARDVAALLLPVA